MLGNEFDRVLRNYKNPEKVCCNRDELRRNSDKNSFFKRHGMLNGSPDPEFSKFLV